MPAKRRVERGIARGSAGRTKDFHLNNKINKRRNVKIEGRRGHSHGGSDGRDNIGASEETTHATTQAVAEHTHGTRAENPSPRRRGRPRKVARQPFLIAVKRFLEAPEIQAYYRTSTLDRYGRDLRKIGRDLWRLRRAGRLQSTQPESLMWADLCVVIQDWKQTPTSSGLPIDVETLNKRLDVLAAFLGWLGNSCIDVAKQRKLYRRPVAPQKDIRTLSDDELALLRRGAEAMEGWWGSVARFLVVILPATGLRPSEIRQARLTDINMTAMSIVVAHPKGEGSYGRQREVPIDSGARRAILDFLADREAFLGNQPHEA